MIIDKYSLKSDFMKTKLLISSLVFSVLGSNQLIAQPPTVSVYTPKGSSVTAYQTSEIWSYQDKLDWGAAYATAYPYATEQGTATTTSTYNCHSYAWNMSEGGPTCWIGYYYTSDEDIYWTDGSYVETTEPYASKISYYADNHSARQTSTQGIYISKWGDKVLMLHARDYGPASYQMAYRKYYKLWPEIIGTFTALCYNLERTFSSNMSIPGSTYTWTKDNNLLDYVSGAGTISYRVKAKNNSGDAWIQFQMTTPSGEVATRYEWVWVNKPVLNSIGGPTYGYTDNTYYYYAVPTYEQRSLSTYTMQLQPLNSNYVDDYNTGWAYITFYDPDYYTFLMKADNTCGTTGWKFKNIIIDQIYGFSISPNPASEVANIKVSKTSSAKTESELPDFDINIFDINGILYQTDKKSGFEFTIPVSNLREGTYIVNIKYGKKSSSLPLLIKH